jgi:hypothetical protein
LLSFVFAAGLSLATIAVAWIAYRPLLGGALLFGAVSIFYVGATRRAAAKTA